MTGSVLDTALGLSVVAGFTNVGYVIRSRGWKPLRRMEGRVVVASKVVTTAASALGLAAAGGFTRLGAAVWLAVRYRERSETVQDNDTAPQRRSGLPDRIGYP